MDTISPNFVYAFMLRRFRLGLLPGIFHKLVSELWPLIDVKISFALNINKRTEFFYKFFIDKIPSDFLQIGSRVMTLD